METIHPEDRERVTSWFGRVLQREEVVLKYRIVRPDGAVRWVRHTMFPIQDEQGQVRQVGGSIQDITNHSGSLVYIIASRGLVANFVPGGT